MNLDKINEDIRSVKLTLKTIGLTHKTIESISTRALRSGRKQTGQFRSNRASRWRLNPNDPQYGTELDCKLILLKLYAQLFEFYNAPDLPERLQLIFNNYVKKPIVSQSYKDPLTKEYLCFEKFCIESNNPIHGHSQFHIGHHNPKLHPKHTPNNINWRTHRSNMAQSDVIMLDDNDFLVGNFIIKSKTGEIIKTMEQSMPLLIYPDGSLVCMGSFQIPADIAHILRKEAWPKDFV